MILSNQDNRFFGITQFSYPNEPNGALNITQYPNDESIRESYWLAADAGSYVDVDNMPIGPHLFDLLFLLLMAILIMEWELNGLEQKQDGGGVMGFIRTLCFGL